MLPPVMNWPYPPYLLPIVLSTTLAAVLTLYSWRRRATPGALALSGLTLGTTLWLLGYTFELTGPDLENKLFWARFQYFGIVMVPAMWLVFALQFAKKGHWLTRPRAILLAVIPLLTLILVWTNDQHLLIWRGFKLPPAGYFPALKLEYGPGFWLYWGYSQVVLLTGTWIILGVLRTSLHLHRWQGYCLLVGVITPWIGNAIYILKLSSIKNLDLTPFGMLVSCSAFTFSLVHFHLLDLLPVAQKAVIESMGDGVIVLDPRDRVVDLNPTATRLLGRNLNSAIGRVMSPEMAPWSKILARSDRSREARTEIVAKVGSDRRILDVRVTPLHDRRQNLSGRIVVLRDITELKRAEEVLATARDQAIAASRLKSELLARVSHELRTPLSIILGYTEMLQTGSFGPVTEEQKQVSEEVLNATRELTALVDQLLDQAQLESGRMKLRLSLVNVGELVDDVLCRVRLIAQAKRLTLSASVATEVPSWLVGDRTRLEQILVNLVSNAIKFTSVGGVRVRVFCPDARQWCLQVSDTGVGIPVEAQGSIFEPFHQVDGSNTRRHGGIGLGLSIVRQFTALMDAQISLESMPGQGSTFTLTFPLKTELES
jgi:PAS domain S-box-containing protein